jgi:excisionase family DNA binding protein
MQQELTTAEAAEALGVSIDTVRARIQRGQMQARRVGARLLLVPQSEVDRWRQLGKLRPWGARELGRQRPEPKPGSREK